MTGGGLSLAFTLISVLSGAFFTHVACVRQKAYESGLAKSEVDLVGVANASKDETNAASEKPAKRRMSLLMPGPRNNFIGQQYQGSWAVPFRKFMNASTGLKPIELPESWTDLFGPIKENGKIWERSGAFGNVQLFKKSDGRANSSFRRVAVKFQKVHGDEMPDVVGEIKCLQRALIPTSAGIPLPVAWTNPWRGNKHVANFVAGVPLLREKYAKGESVEYLSSGLGWVRATVTRVRRTGTLDLDTVLEGVEKTTADVPRKKIRKLAAKHRNGVVELLAFSPRNLLSKTFEKQKQYQVWLQFPYYPMSLAEIIGTEKLTLKVASELAYDIATGLQTLHMNNVWHNDLKPDNVLVSDDLHAYITDFGGSCIPGEVACTGYKTTPFYAPPEIMKHVELTKAEGGGYSFRLRDVEETRPFGRGTRKVTINEQYGPKVDIYSFGVILTHLAFNEGGHGMTDPIQAEFFNQEAFDLEELIKKESHHKALKDEPGYHLKSILRGCLDRNPKNRWSTSRVLRAVRHWKDSVHAHSL